MSEEIPDYRILRKEMGFGVGFIYFLRLNYSQARGCNKKNPRIRDKSWKHDLNGCNQRCII